MEIGELSLYVYGLTELIKSLLPEKVKPYVPFLAMAMGGVMMWYMQSPWYNEAIVRGVLLGAAASGVYKGAKKALS